MLFNTPLVGLTHIAGLKSDIRFMKHAIFFVICRHDVERDQRAYLNVFWDIVILCSGSFFCSEASNSCPIGNNESPFNRTKEHFQDIG